MKIQWRLNFLTAKILGKEKVGWFRVLRELFSRHTPSINLKVEEGIDNLLKISFPDGVWIYWPAIINHGCLGSLWRELNYPGGHNYFQFYCPSKSDVVFDVGACEGLFSLYLREKVNKLYLFEPIKELQTSLEKTFAEEVKSGMAVIENIALAKTNGYVDFKLDKNDICCSSISNDKNTSSEIKAFTLDRYVCERGIKKIDVIKADIEGAELDLLDGARQTLAELKPRLIICTYHNPSDFNDIATFLQNFDYNIKFSDFIFKPDGRLPYMRRGLIYAY